MKGGVCGMQVVGDAYRNLTKLNGRNHVIDTGINFKVIIKLFLKIKCERVSGRIHLIRGRVH